MAEKRKGDNNGDICSDKKRAHKTLSFERKLDILKRIDNGEGHGEIARSLGLSRSTVSTIVKNRVKIMEHVKSVGSLKSIIVNPKRSVVTEEMEHVFIIWLDDQAQRPLFQLKLRAFIMT
jgi:FixJ family two-component response regulator